MFASDLESNGVLICRYIINTGITVMAAHT